jgi:hypothetical protein
MLWTKSPTCVTGIYRQRMRWVTAIVALAVTLMLGVDTFALTDSQWRERTVSGATQGAAQSSQNSPVSGLQEAVSPLFSLTCRSDGVRVLITQTLRVG